MNILKPQKNHIEKLKSENIINIQETEKITCCNFENEECNNINLHPDDIGLSMLCHYLSLLLFQYK